MSATVQGSSNTAVTWQVNGVTGGNSTFGTISVAGLYKAPASLPNPNTVTVTAISQADPSKSATATLTITAAALVSISVTPVNPSIALGTTQQFTATGTFSDGSTQDLTASVSLSWSSSSAVVATISNSPGSHGLATAAGTGSVTITATLGSVSGSTTLTVKLI